MRVKTRKGLAFLLTFALAVTAMFTGNVMRVKAAPTDISFQIKITVAEGTMAPENYGVEYQVVDADGNNLVGEGYAGYVRNSDEPNVAINGVEDTCKIKIKVISAGLGVRLKGADVTAEGWTDGKAVEVSAINGQEYSFELFAAPPQGGDGQENPPQPNAGEISFSVKNAQNGTVCYSLDGTHWDEVPASNVVSAEALNNALVIYLKAEPKPGQMLDTHEKQNMLAFDGQPVAIDTDKLLAGTYSFQYDNSKTYAVNIAFENGGNEGGGEEGGNDGGNEFSGNVYFVWQGANDGVCFHKFTGLTGAYTNEQGQWTYDTNFIPVSSVVAEGTTEHFVIQSNRNDTYYYWVWENAIDTVKEYKSFENLRTDIEEKEELRRSIAIDPCGAKDGNGTVNTYGNREFRATIYEDTSFEGISFGRNRGDYTYFPKWWDTMLFTNELDVTGSTKNDPAVYEAFVLEPKIQFQTTANSANTITAVRPLAVPTGAVNVVSDGAGNFDITFGSNFFDDVVFELTAAEETYYVKIVRTAIRVHDNFGPGQTNPEIICSLYYDGNETAGNYDLMATVYYKDGSTEIKKLTPATIDNDGGVGMKYAEYALAYTDDMTGIAYTAVEAGALSGDSFGGIFIGSDVGTYYDIDARSIIY